MCCIITGSAIAVFILNVLAAHPNALKNALALPATSVMLQYAKNQAVHCMLPCTFSQLPQCRDINVPTVLSLAFSTLDKSAYP